MPFRVSRKDTRLCPRELRALRERERVQHHRALTERHGQLQRAGLTHVVRNVVRLELLHRRGGG